MIGHEVTMLICSITESEERKQDTRLLFTATNYGQILVCKFLEAWDSFNALAESNRRVKEIAQAVSPAIRRITKTWPRIRHYRNWALAHPYSIREESEITPPWKLLDLGVAPNQNAEVFLLLECVRFAITGVLAYYGEIYRPLHPTFEVGRTQATRGVKDGAEAEDQRVRLAELLNARLEELGVNLKDPVFKEFTCSGLRERAETDQVAKKQ